MKRNTRDRLVLPILLPVGLLVGMLAVMFLFSRILLNTSASAATVVALVVSIAVIAAAGVIATRKRMAASASLGSLLGVVAGVAMLAGGIALGVASPGEEGGEGEGGEAFAAEIAAPEGAAADGFDIDTLAFPSDTPIALAFDNQDPGVQHNVAIFDGDPETDAGAPTLFEGNLVTGPIQTTYDIAPLVEGSYPFHCTVHPTTMKGTVEVAPGGGEGAGGPSLAIVAEGLEFDTDELTFAADTPTTLALDNRDAGTQHNVAIYDDEALGETLFKGDLVTGVATMDYEVPGLPTGQFYFQCDVHTAMAGAVRVEKGGGAAESGGAAQGGSAGEAEGGPDGQGTGPTGPPPEPTGTGVAVIAKDFLFDVNEITLPAGTETPLAFDNQDPGVLHNLAIYDDPALPVDTGTAGLFTFEPVPGVVQEQLTIPPIPAGTYTFQCDVHPNMAGTVSVS